MAKLEFSSESTSLSLEEQMKVFAMETSVVFNLTDALKSLISNGLTAKLTSIVTHFTSSDDMTRQLSVAEKEFASLQPMLTAQFYVNYEKTLVSVPEGFKGDLLDYTIFLGKHSEDVYKHANDTLSHYTAILASFLSNKDDKISLKDYTAFYKEVERKRLVIVEDLSKFFKDRSDLSKSYLTNVLDRVADLQPLLRQTENLYRLHKKRNLKDLANGVNHAVDMLNLVGEQLQTGAISMVSRNAAANLAEGAYEVARYVEFVSSYAYRVEQLVSCVCKLISQLTELTKR